MANDALVWSGFVALVLVVVYYCRLYALTNKLGPWLLFAAANLWAAGLRIAAHIDQLASPNSWVVQHWQALIYPTPWLNLAAAVWLFYSLRPVYNRTHDQRKQDKEGKDQ